MKLKLLSGRMKVGRKPSMLSIPFCLESQSVAAVITLLFTVVTWKNRVVWIPWFSYLSYLNSFQRAILVQFPACWKIKIWQLWIVFFSFFSILGCLRATCLLKHRCSSDVAKSEVMGWFGCGAERCPPGSVPLCCCHSSAVLLCPLCSVCFFWVLGV